MLWRSTDSIQLELGRRSVIIDGVDAADVRALLGTDPPTGIDDADRSIDAAATAALVDGGFLLAAPDGAAPPAPRPRLASELAALRTRHGSRAGVVLKSRDAARVLITGDTAGGVNDGGRLGPAIGALLAAAGIGRVHVAGTGDVRLRSALPGGFAVGDEGRDFQEACAELLHRAAPEVHTGASMATDTMDLVIVCTDGPVEDDVRRSLHDTTQAHLAVRCAGDHLVVGPLVLPGLTSCLRCADLHRIDRDPAWSALAVQLAVRPKYPPASDVALAATAASVASMHALAFLDGDEPASINGTIELELPDWRLRRRSWSVRSDCGCATAQ